MRVIDGRARRRKMERSGWINQNEKPEERERERERKRGRMDRMERNSEKPLINSDNL